MLLETARQCYRGDFSLSCGVNELEPHVCCPRRQQQQQPLGGGVFDDRNPDVGCGKSIVQGDFYHGLGAYPFVARVGFKSEYTLWALSKFNIFVRRKIASRCMLLIKLTHEGRCDYLATFLCVANVQWGSQREHMKIRALERARLIAVLQLFFGHCLELGKSLSTYFTVNWRALFDRAGNLWLLRQLMNECWFTWLPLLKCSHDIGEFIRVWSASLESTWTFNLGSHWGCKSKRLFNTSVHTKDVSIRDSQWGPCIISNFPLNKNLLIGLDNVKNFLKALCTVNLNFNNSTQMIRN